MAWRSKVHNIVTEMAEQPANYYQLLEYRHGPIVAAGKNTVVFISGRDVASCPVETRIFSGIQ